MNNSILFSQLLLLAALTQAFADTVLRGSIKETRIIDGNRVDDERYPYFSSMRGSSLCGAVLISKRFVLTAAHCVGADRNFQIGITDLNFGSTTSHDEYHYNNVYIHPEYNEQNFDYDIALYELQEDVPDNIPYIHLREDPVTVPGTPMTVMGFGKTEAYDDTSLSDYLLQTTVNYVPQSKCNGSVCSFLYGPYDRLTMESCISQNNMITPSMICGYKEGTDSCQGDSGGPLIIKSKNNNPREDYLVGIVSWGYSCTSDAPGMYANISHTFGWIVDSMCAINPDAVPYYIDCDYVPVNVDEESGFLSTVRQWFSHRFQ